MKHLIITLFTITMLATGCSSEIPEIQDPIMSQPQESTISIRKALSNADKLFALIEGNTRATRVVKSIEPVGEKIQTRANEAQASKYYIVNYANDGGFAVISADHELGTIYAIGERGNISLNDTLNNPGLAMFFNNLNAVNSITTTNSGFGPGDGRDTIADEMVDIVDFILPQIPEAVQSWPGGKYAFKDMYPSQTIAISQIFTTFAWPNKWEVKEEGSYKTLYTETIDWNMLRDYRFPTNISATSDAGGREMKKLFDLVNADFDFPWYEHGNPMKELFSTREYEVDEYYNPPVVYVDGVGSPHEEPMISYERDWKNMLKGGKLIIAFDSNRVDSWKWVVDGFIEYGDIKPNKIKDLATNLLFHCVWGKTKTLNGYFALINHSIIASSGLCGVSDDVLAAMKNSPFIVCYGIKKR